MNDAANKLDRALSALAHPVRRGILQRVMHREMPVTELARPYAISLNAVSKHIQMLERAALVRRRRVWRQHLVSYRPGALDDITRWVEQTQKFWNAKLDALEALLKEEDAAARRPRKKGP